MTKPLRFDEEAREELKAAASWYEERRSTLGLRFLSAVNEVLEIVQTVPLAAPLVPYVSKELGVRRRVVPAFPYAVIYIDLSDEIRILAIAHSRRDPTYWRERLSDE